MTDDKLERIVKIIKLVKQADDLAFELVITENVPMWRNITSRAINDLLVVWGVGEEECPIK